MLVGFSTHAPSGGTICHDWWWRSKRAGGRGAGARASLPRFAGATTDMPPKKRKRDGAAAEGDLDDDEQQARDDAEDAEMQQRLEERRKAENDRMRCAQYIILSLRRVANRHGLLSAEAVPSLGSHGAPYSGRHSIVNNRRAL